MTGVAADTLVNPYKLLLDDYVMRVTIWFTAYLALPFISIKVVNSGVIQRITDDGVQIDFNDIDKLSNLCRGQGEFYKQRLIDYLCANSKLFPEYTQNESGEMGAEKVNYSGGLNLEKYT